MGWHRSGPGKNSFQLTLIDDTLITRAVASCGTNTSIGDSLKYGLPHNVVVYLNGGNGYSPDVNGLFALVNDVLGGVNITVSASDVQQAVDVINNAFEHCRILVGTIPYREPLLVNKKVTNTKELDVLAYPNPYTSRFNLAINSPVSGLATIEFFTVNGSKVYEMKKLLPANMKTTVLYTGPVRFVTLLYKVTIGKNSAAGIVIKPN